MLRTLATSAILLTLTVLRLPAIQAEEAVRVFQQVGPAVVGIESVANTGTGLLLTNTGLILTNAHVVAVPLKYKCRVEIMQNGQRKTVTFTKTKVTKFHKDYDLALMQIDPKEHNARLASARLHRAQALTGQRVYAIGNPASDVDLNKTITEGLLSGVNRRIEGVNYYQISAPINPGNSGGPLCDAKGNVLGLVTLKSTEADNVGFAIPLHTIRMTQFIDREKLPADIAKSKEILVAADKLSSLAYELWKRGHGESDEYIILRALAYQGYMEALVKNPNNYNIYVSLAISSRELEEHDAALEFLFQALQACPWPTHSDVYRQLGVQLMVMKRPTDALTVWQEGVAKYPIDGAKIWEDLAIASHNAKKYDLAAKYAATTLLVADQYTRKDVALSILRSGTKQVPKGSRQRQVLEADVSKLPQTIEQRVATAKQLWQKKSLSSSAAFRSFLQRNDIQIRTAYFAAKEPQMPARLANLQVLDSVRTID